MEYVFPVKEFKILAESQGNFGLSGKRQEKLDHKIILEIHTELIKTVTFTHSFVEDKLHTEKKGPVMISILRTKLIFQYILVTFKQFAVYNSYF